MTRRGKIVALAVLVAAGCANVEFKPRSPTALDQLATAPRVDTSASALPSAMPSTQKMAWPAAPVPEERRLKNGVRVLLRQEHAFPLIGFGVVVQRGSIDAPPGTYSLFVDSMTSGSDLVSPKALGSDFYEYAVKHEVDVRKEWSSVDAQFVAALLPTVVRMVVRTFAAPTFDSDAFDELLALHRRNLESATRERGRMARRELYKLLFEGHPYGEDDLDATLDGVKLASIRALQDTVAADDVAVVAAGDVTMDKLTPLLEETLGSLRPRATPRRTYGDAPVPAAGHVVAIDQPDDTQAQLAIGYAGVRWDDPDFPALFALAKIVQDSAHGLLRLGDGITYGVSSGLPMMRTRGPVVVTAAVDAHRVGDALRDTFAAVDRLQRSLEQPGEIDRLENWILGSWPAPDDTVERSVDSLEVLAGLGLPADAWTKLRAAVEKLTANDLVRVGRRYLDPARAQVVLIGDVNRFRASLDDLRARGMAVDVRSTAR